MTSVTLHITVSPEVGFTSAEASCFTSCIKQVWLQVNHHQQQTAASGEFCHIHCTEGLFRVSVIGMQVVEVAREPEEECFVKDRLCNRVHFTSVTLASSLTQPFSCRFLGSFFSLDLKKVTRAESSGCSICESTRDPYLHIFSSCWFPPWADGYFFSRRD